MKGGFLRSAAAFGAVSIFSVSLQAAPAAPTPGQVQSTLPTQLPQPKKAQAPALPSGPTNAAGIAPGGPAFKVNAFDIQGNTAIPTDELRAQIAGYLGQTLTLSQLYDVADVLTRYYRARGYGLAYVAPPAQKLSGGTVKLQVVEGRIGDINIQGNSRTRTPVLAQRARGLQSGALYTDAAAERAVLLMNDLPGVTARAVLSPGADYGTSDVAFNVDERAMSGDFSVDDYGRASIGRWRINADAAVNSLTGSADQLSAGITHSEANLLNFGKLAYLFPLGEASTLTANFNRAFYHVGGAFAAAHITGSTQNSGLTWQYAQIRTQPESLFWGVGITHDTSRTLTQVTTNITLLQLTMLYSRQFQDLSYYNINGSFWTNGKSNADAAHNDAE
ncbi:MAG TPA: POTRA domain-containing protein, partial [Gammaproteobacteria bacterium]|nr:POTRA domain-containing protein [Gammaproteobacteria bacterium]